MKKLAEKLLALGILTTNGMTQAAMVNYVKKAEPQHKLHRQLRPHISNNGSQTVLLQ